jgi:hypothetical protein
MINKEHIQRENFASESMKRVRKKKIEITPNNDHSSLESQLKNKQNKSALRDPIF